MRSVVTVLAMLACSCLAEPPEGLEVEDDHAIALVADVEAAGYRDWDPPPSSDDLPRRQAAGPHGAWVQVYLHPDLLEAFVSEEALEAWPPGVAAVCESYDSEQAELPFLINVMRKDDDGWVWAQVDAEGRALTDERPDDCIGCHAGADDYVFSLFLREE